MSLEKAFFGETDICLCNYCEAIRKSDVGTCLTCKIVYWLKCSQGERTSVARSIIVRL